MADHGGDDLKKYEKVHEADYMKWHQENQAYRDSVKMDADRLSYHLMPETGWLNDPNGLCQFKGTYHIYYQYTPFEPTGELKLWGHYATKDFIRYVNAEPVLYPDQDCDAHGVYSGSAWVENDIVHYFYTGNVKYFDRDDYDYIMKGRGSNTIHCTSRDGYHFSSKEVLLTNADYPPDMSAHIRDPKLIMHEGSYYMALGARDGKGRGMVLVYQSQDLTGWSYHGRIAAREPFGYMWECPDLFALDGQLCLVCCPQGVAREGVDYWNVHQCTIAPIDYDFRPGDFYIDAAASMRMVDRGFDFYAPQTFLDEQGRRILIGWMGIPDADYTNPTVEKGWQHALTIPRVLHMKEGRLVQAPVKELEAMRGPAQEYDIEQLSGGIDAGLVFEGCLRLEECGEMQLKLRGNVALTWKDGLLTLDMGAAGSGRDVRHVKLDSLRNVRIFSDTSSLELFINDGEEVFTTRAYGHDGGLKLSGGCGGRLTLYTLSGFIYEEA